MTNLSTDQPYVEIVPHRSDEFLPVDDPFWSDPPTTASVMCAFCGTEESGPMAAMQTLFDQHAQVHSYRTDPA